LCPSLRAECAQCQSTPLPGVFTPADSRTVTALRRRSRPASDQRKPPGEPPSAPPKQYLEIRPPPPLPPTARQAWCSSPPPRASPPVGRGSPLTVRAIASTTPSSSPRRSTHPAPSTHGTLPGAARSSAPWGARRTRAWKRRRRRAMLCACSCDERNGSWKMRASK
jgi:hypothetical protein